MRREPSKPSEVLISSDTFKYEAHGCVELDPLTLFVSGTDAQSLHFHLWFNYSQEGPTSMLVFGFQPMESCELSISHPLLLTMDVT